MNATSALRELSRPRLTLGTEALALIASVFFALACNQPFWSAVLAGRDPGRVTNWVFAASILVALVGIHFILLCLLFTRRTARPVLALLLIVTAFATYYMDTFAVFLDPSMLRNVFATELKESRDLLVPGMLLHVLIFAGLPLLLLWPVRIRARTLPRAALLRTAAILGGLVLTSGAILLVFQDFGSLMRNQKEVRYLITPANYLYSSARVLTAKTAQTGHVRTVVGADAHVPPIWQATAKPTLFVMVVGETARAANWGLNGYARQTTPQLAQLDVINFPSVTSCGTDTETSVPCMFSAIGRRDYNEDRIRGSDSLLHLLARAGFNVLWRDNNTGCKGVCADLPQERVDQLVLPGLCGPDRCLDETLLHGMDTIARDNKGNLFLVLHQMGNHGPAYFNRYPAALRKFVPTCDTLELRKCSQQEIVNAYDNALLYTDDFLAKTIAFLKTQEHSYDTAMIYVSDHGESLGESGLYLHGIPYVIAPKYQREVPMIAWFSPDFLQDYRLDQACLRERASKPVSHDNLFHTILGLLRVQTSTLEPALDLSDGCRLPLADPQAKAD